MFLCRFRPVSRGLQHSMWDGLTKPNIPGLQDNYDMHGWPDMCTLFSLYQKKPIKNINLKDLLEQFFEVLELEPAAAETDEGLQGRCERAILWKSYDHFIVPCRFLFALSQLHYVGAISSTSQNTKGCVTNKFIKPF